MTRIGEHNHMLIFFFFCCRCTVSKAYKFLGLLTFVC